MRNYRFLVEYRARGQRKFYELKEAVPADTEHEARRRLLLDYLKEGAQVSKIKLITQRKIND